MSRALVFFSIAFVLFASAASLSWILQNRHDDAADQITAQEDQRARKKGATPKRTTVGSNDESLPPIIRPPVALEADRMVKVAESLQQQQEALKEREQQLALREKQISLVHEEIKKDQKKVNAIRQEVQIELKLMQQQVEILEKRAAAAELERQKTKGQLDELAKTTLELDVLESKNLKQLAAIYDKMDSDAAAQSIIQLVDRGKIETAAVLLANMNLRQAAAILGEISKQGEGLAVQLHDRMRYMKSPATLNQQ